MYRTGVSVLACPCMYVSLKVYVSMFRNHRVGRVLSFFLQSSESRLPHPPCCRRVCHPPFGPGGGDAHSLAGEGWGSPNSDEGIYTVVHYMYKYFRIRTNLSEPRSSPPPTSHQSPPHLAPVPPPPRPSPPPTSLQSPPHLAGRRTSAARVTAISVKCTLSTPCGVAFLRLLHLFG